MEIASKYNPSEVEDKWYKYWMDNKMFHSEPDGREPYTIVIPPPNVTGVLHMGHMLNNTIQDILIRRARMQGKNACWVPGMDHASIATEAKVVGRLAEKGIKKTDLTREEFLEHAWAWTKEHGGIILEQLKKLGASCDWDRRCFTMDEKRSESVIKVFCDLYEKGLIYRGVRMVNWDPAAKTALSDEEVIYKTSKSKLYYLRYKIVGEEGYAVVATTRPETIPGDTAMCINPNDPKNQHLRGKKVIVPIINREIPVIEDEYVDIEFGTGCLKVTPAHDVNDYMLGEKYNLETIDIFNDDGTLNKNGMMYEGMDRFTVRKKIEKDLTDAGLMEKVEDYSNSVGYSERTKVPIEPKLSMQWFLKMTDLAKPALDAVMSDEIKLVPPKFKNTYRHWMENVRDWCISRQLWWGHRIPAYFLPEGGYVVASDADEALKKANEKMTAEGKPLLKKEDLRQEEDSLDTWFSSWLWPFSVFDGVNNPDNEDMKYYYPTNDLVTGPDILFFWVARMIIAGYEYTGKPCFRNVYLTGIVRDNLGRKMSKSLGNSPDPLKLISDFGADGVRMGMMLAAPAGNDILFDDGLCEQGRNFCNKIWNAYRLVNGWNVSKEISQPEESSLAYKCFDAQLKKSVADIDDLFGKFRISEALMAVYKLFRDEFSSWYLEIIKPSYVDGVSQPVDEKTMGQALDFFEQLLLLLHPFMPFITEELWQNIKERTDGESIMTALQPSVAGYDDALVSDYENAKAIISSIRSIRLDKNIPNKEALKLIVPAGHVSDFNCILSKMANLSEIVSGTSDSTSLSFMVGTLEYSVPLGNFVNIEEEAAKIRKELDYTEGFLKSVMKKLGNERFVQNAKPEIVENERKKKADAERKIILLKESLASLK